MQLDFIHLSILEPENYYLDFELPANHLFSPKDAGADGVDSDADPITGKTSATALSAGESDMTWDAGMYVGAQSSIGNYVWIDLDHDGIQDVGENGYPSATVELYTGAGIYVDNTTTDGNGFYSFTNLAPADYYVKFILPSGYDFTLQNAGADDVDSDANTSTGQTAVTTLSSGENDTSWDAGLYSDSMQLLVIMYGKIRIRMASRMEEKLV